MVTDTSDSIASARRPRTLALGLVEALGDRIRDGRLASGDKLPTEVAIMDEFGVSRTVVREAISKLQAAGLVQTLRGVGTFVVGLGDAAAFRIAPEQLATLRDVVAVLELRIDIETEARSARRAEAHREKPRGHAIGAGCVRDCDRAGPRRDRP